MKSKNILYLIISLILIILFYFLYSNFNKDKTNTSFLGNWSGYLSSPTKQILVQANFTDIDGEIDLKISSPTINQYSIPVDSLFIDGNKVSFAINKLKVRYEGLFLSDSGKINGTWSQSNSGIGLTLYRAEEIYRFNRPQAPFKPFGYSSDSISFVSSDTISLAGTFTYPNNTNKKFPAIILVNGLGKHDRDESMYGHKPFLVIADYFTKKGFAVLRVDDRGVGLSGGDFSSATTEDFALDLAAAIDFIKSKEIVDINKIGVLGFNEGGLVASMAIAKRNDINFLVLLATPGLKGRDIFLTQTRELQSRYNVSEDEINRDYNINRKMYDVVESVNDTSIAIKKFNVIYNDFRLSLPEEELAKSKYSQSTFNAQVKLMTSPWFKYYLTYNPESNFSKIECPVLILYGKNDLQVEPTRNLEAIKSALANSGNSNVKGIIFPKLNHLFQESEIGLPTEYSKIKATISFEVLDEISDWLKNIQI